MKPLEHIERVLRRLAVGNCRARRDDVERISNHVRNNQRDQPPRATRSRQPSALDAAELFANRIEFLDVGTRAAQVFRDGLFVSERNGFDGGGEQRRATTGNQAEAQVVRTKRVDDFQDPPRTSDSRFGWFIHPRRSGAVQCDVRQRSHAIFGDVHPAGELLRGCHVHESPFHSGSHAGPGFACPYHGDAIDFGERKRLLADDQILSIDLKVLSYQSFAVDGIDTRPPDR